MAITRCPKNLNFSPESQKIMRYQIFSFQRLWFFTIMSNISPLYCMLLCTPSKLVKCTLLLSWPIGQWLFEITDLIDQSMEQSVIILIDFRWQWMCMQQVAPLRTSPAMTCLPGSTIVFRFAKPFCLVFTCFELVHDGFYRFRPSSPRLRNCALELPIVSSWICSFLAAYRSRRWPT